MAGRSGLRHGIAWIMAAALALGLWGCATASIVPPAVIAGTIEGVSLNQTGKTMSDHIASWVTGQDCSILRYTKDGKYCVTAAELAKQDAELHRPYYGTCYRVRGNVTCYDQADATHTSETLIYNNP